MTTKQPPELSKPFMTTCAGAIGMLLGANHEYHSEKTKQLGYELARRLLKEMPKRNGDAPKPLKD